MGKWWALSLVRVGDIYFCPTSSHQGVRWPIKGPTSGTLCKSFETLLINSYTTWPSIFFLLLFNYILYIAFFQKFSKTCTFKRWCSNEPISKRGDTLHLSLCPLQVCHDLSFFGYSLDIDAQLLNFSPCLGCTLLVFTQLPLLCIVINGSLCYWLIENWQS